MTAWWNFLYTPKHVNFLWALKMKLIIFIRIKNKGVHLICLNVCISQKHVKVLGFKFSVVEIPYSHCSQNNNNHRIYQMFYILPPVLKRTVSFSLLNEGLWLLQSILQPKTWWPSQIIYQPHIVPPLQYLSKSSFVLSS